MTFAHGRGAHGRSRGSLACRQQVFLAHAIVQRPAAVAATSQRRPNQPHNHAHTNQAHSAAVSLDRSASRALCVNKQQLQQPLVAVALVAVALVIRALASGGKVRGLEKRWCPKLGLRGVHS